MTSVTAFDLFLNDPAILATRLIRRSNNLDLDRWDCTDEEGSSWPKPDTSPLPPDQKAIWEEFLSQARHGAALEPNNAFFDKMLTAALLALRRDSEAFQVAGQRPDQDGVQRSWAGADDRLPE